MEKPELKALRMDPDHWKAGIIYYCNDDPRMIVRNRHVIGWTWNFAHPAAVPVIVAIIGVVVGGYWLLLRSY